MGDKTGIEWTEATAVVDRSGRRVRWYVRKHPDRPGSQARKAMAKIGKKWCRGCRSWLPIHAVSRNGTCRPCQNSIDRDLYQIDPDHRARRKAHASKRKRGVPPMPPTGAELLLELFEGQCAYCDEPATSWDHVVPVSRGGAMVPGNMLPACKSCNSAKHNHEWHVWFQRAPAMKAFTVEYLTELGSVEWPVDQQ